MNKSMWMTTLVAWGLIGAQATAEAQVAGSSSQSVTVTETTGVVAGWSVKKSVLGKSVFTESGTRIGTVEDLIISPDRNVSYVILGAGGFIGIGRHDVAVPVAQIRSMSGRLVMPGATRESVKALPEFSYAAVDEAGRKRLIDVVDEELAQAKLRLDGLQKRAGAAVSDEKQRLTLQQRSLQDAIQSLEDKTSAMRKASASQWKAFEGEVNAAQVRLHKAVEATTT